MKVFRYLLAWSCRLLVGAPEADARQPGVTKGGAVYKCSARAPGQCEIIPFDKKGEEHGYNVKTPHNRLQDPWWEGTGSQATASPGSGWAR